VEVAGVDACNEALRPLYEDLEALASSGGENVVGVVPLKAGEWEHLEKSDAAAEVAAVDAELVVVSVVAAVVAFPSTETAASKMWKKPKMLKRK